MINAVPPDVLYGELFKSVQNSRIFPDSKTFVDAIPKCSPENIKRYFESAKIESRLDLLNFVNQYFEFPAVDESDGVGNERKEIEQYISDMWLILRRDSDRADDSSLIALPKPYIVPGGRFREIYYWDSYFTLLGLAESGDRELIESMVDNFSYLIDKIGHIPNGNRNYYCSRSQPPFFAMMVELLAEVQKDKSVLCHYLTQLEKEYQFWMAGADRLHKNGEVFRRCLYAHGVILNRHWDDNPEPRQESYLEDLEVASCSQRNSRDLYRNIRAACETGWDFSSRWLEKADDFTSIRTTEVVPIDLNCVLYKLERVIAEAYGITGDFDAHNHYHRLADMRKKVLQTLFYSSANSTFNDLLLTDFSPTGKDSLAMAYPLFFNIATPDQAFYIADTLKRRFLKPGGWVTTPVYTEHQWDAPNGWAPLQWIVYRGLCNYGFVELARLGAQRWIDNCESVYRQTGLMLEKYDVETLGNVPGGGEYQVQHGFGWTNAIYVKLKHALNSFTSVEN